MDVTIFKEKAFMVRLRIVRFVKLSPEIAGGEHLALLLARNSVIRVKVEDINDIVQFSTAGVVFRGAIVNWWVIRS